MNGTESGTSWDGTEIVVQRYEHTIPVSCCLLTDATGVDHCTHERRRPARPLRQPWWRRGVGGVGRLRSLSGAWLARVASAVAQEEFLTMADARDRSEDY